MTTSSENLPPCFTRTCSQQGPPHGQLVEQGVGACQLAGARGLPYLLAQPWVRLQELAGILIMRASRSPSSPGAGPPE